MRLLTSIYAVVIFLSAFLLFIAEPMVAKQLLPFLGGSSAVWTTCLLFFQVGLLAGYTYAHALVRRLSPRAQTVTHTGLLALATAVLAIHASPNAGAAVLHPILSILWMLSAMIGLPYLALSATTPLVQDLHARTALPVGSLPIYRFFAISNLGSLLALLAYPTLVETRLTLKTQALLWSWGFFIFAILCSVLAWQARGARPTNPPETVPSAIAAHAIGRRALWILLPACSSTLLCAVTNHLSQNIAAIPLLWILPLVVYLLSFIVTFHSARAYPRWLALRLLALALATVGYVLFSVRTTLPIQIAIPVWCAALFLICLFCHGELYRLRPREGAATDFYLLLSFGSVLGAAFVAVIAPRIFSSNYELICGLILSAVLALAATWQSGWGARVVWSLAVVTFIYVGHVEVSEWSRESLVQARSFYGTIRVTESHVPPEAGTSRILYHGSIQHGIQLFGNGLRTVPTSYYATDSGIGLALAHCCEGHPRRIGVVGLGAGTLAAYGQPGEVIRFYELDPLVVRLARNLFTFLRESKAQVEVIEGDARVSMQGEQAQRYDVLVLDAFSGDAVPVHLLTTQALVLYQRHLATEGVLAFHISSQYLDLEPVLAMEARNAGMQAVVVHSAANPARGEFVADWVLMTRSSRFLGQEEIASHSHRAIARAGVGIWTDDFNSVLPVLKPLRLSAVHLPR